MKNKKKFLPRILLAVLVGLFFLLPVVHFDALSISAPAQASTGLSGKLALGITMPTKANTGLSEESVATILEKFLIWLLGIVGIIALIGFVVSGIQYIVASGSEKGVESAKKNMTYSLIGITVALASYVVVKFIDSVLKGVY